MIDARADAPAIVVIDDDPLVRRVAARLLSREGYRVIEAADATAGLDAAASPSVRAVLTDVVLPGESGLAIAGAMRATRPSIPVLFMTGLDAGCDGLDAHEVCVRKPFTPRTLLEAVEAALSARAARQHAAE